MTTIEKSLADERMKRRLARIAIYHDSHLGECAATLLSIKDGVSKIHHDTANVHEFEMKLEEALSALFALDMEISMGGDAA